jgi:hypothetical protein
VTTRRPAPVPTDVLNGERAGPGSVTALQTVVARARERGAECSDRARQHNLSYRRWRFWSNLLGVLAATGSAAAAVLLLLGETGGVRAVLGGFIALVAAACAAANSAVVQTRVEEHRTARTVFLNLHTRYVLLGDFPARDLAAARSQLEDIERSQAELEVEAPPPDARTARPPDGTDVAAPEPPPAPMPPSRPAGPNGSSTDGRLEPPPRTAAGAP